VQFKLLVDLIFEPVHNERRRSLPLSVLAKPVDSITCKRANSMQLVFTVLLETQQLFFEQSSLFLFAKSNSSQYSTIRGVMFTSRVTSLTTCIQFWLFIKKYLTNWYKLCT